MTENAVPPVNDNSGSPCRLSVKNGRLHAQLDGKPDDVPVTIIYARPLTSRTEIILLDEDKNELFSLPDIDSLDPACRALAREALQERYHLPRVERVKQSQITFGTHYWTVETDRGSRGFAFKEPGKNVTWLTDDHIIIRDTAGNRFEIESLASLDAASRARILAIL